MKMIMKAIRIINTADQKSWRKWKCSVRTGANEVLIKVHAASVNPSTGNAAGYMKDFFRSLAGHAWSDVSGTSRGWPRCGSIQTGRRSVREPGAGRRRYAEYAVAKETIVAGKPNTLDHVHAAAVPVAGLTGMAGAI